MLRNVPRGLGLAFALLALALPSPPARAAAPAPAPSPAAVADSAGDAGGSRGLLERVGDSYLGLTSYLFEGEVRMTQASAGPAQGMLTSFRLAAAKPRRWRTEITNPTMAVVAVSDGEHTWTYVPQVGQYTQAGFSPPAGADSSAPAVGGVLAAGTPIQRYLAPTGGMLWSRRLRDDTLVVAGRRIPCAVVRAQYEAAPGTPLTLSPNTFWIAAETNVVLRDSVHLTAAGGSGGALVSMDVITTFTTARVDEALPDSLFTFTPPESAKLVEQIGPGAARPPSPLLGMRAPNFTLADLAGKKRSLASLKGKVVLLDFWATWCGPCRVEMPNIVKLHHELSPRGLAVIGVNVGETGAQANAFLKKYGYELPVWLDVKGEAATTYGATGIPTLVVIDRQGLISSHMIGLRGETELREALKKAGIE